MMSTASLRPSGENRGLLQFVGFARSRIESELLQPARDFILDRIVEDRVDDDDAVGRVDRPCGVFLFANIEHVVEDYLDRCGMPRRRVGVALAAPGLSENAGGESRHGC